MQNLKKTDVFHFAISKKLVCFDNENYTMFRKTGTILASFRKEHQIFFFHNKKMKRKMMIATGNSDTFYM